MWVLSRDRAISLFAFYLEGREFEFRRATTKHLWSKWVLVSKQVRLNFGPNLSSTVPKMG